jgi:hypothetical protein
MSGSPPPEGGGDGAAGGHRDRRALGVWHVWRDPGASFAARAATLLTGALLMSPYVFYYGMTWAGLAVGWLALSARTTGFMRGEPELLLAPGLRRC